MQTYCKQAIFVIIFFISLQSVAQNNESFYAFDKNWETINTMDSAAFFAYKLKKSDTLFEIRYYNIVGPMINSETYKDPGLEIPDGRFCWFDPKGRIDSTGKFANGKKEGRWEYFDDTLGLTMTITYEQDSLINIEYPDLKKNKPVEEEKDVTEKVAGFKSGQKGWNDYLAHKLKVTERMTNNLAKGSYTAMVSFIIDKTGNSEDVYLRKSVEWSADKLVVDLIEQSPQWTPAVQKGKTVKYRQLQRITFDIDN